MIYRLTTAVVALVFAFSAVGVDSTCRCAHMVVTATHSEGSATANVDEHACCRAVRVAAAASEAANGRAGLTGRRMARCDCGGDVAAASAGAAAPEVVVSLVVSAIPAGVLRSGFSASQTSRMLRRVRGPPEITWISTPNLRASLQRWTC